MTTSQYKNIIKNVTARLSAEDKKSPQSVISSILKTRGISFIDETSEKIKEILGSNEYLAWKECDSENAQESANNGFAVVAVSDEALFLIRPEGNGFENCDITQSVLTVAEISDKNLNNISYYTSDDGIPTNFGAPIPDRIAQNNDDPQWNASLWKYNGQDYTDKANVCCSSACISMALSCLGTEKTPGQILYENGGGASIVDWNRYSPGKVGVWISKSTDAVKRALYLYRSYCDMYAPPIVLVRSSKPHYAVVCAYDESKGLFLAVDPGAKGYDRAKKKVRYYQWAPNPGQQVIQYRLTTAT